MRKLLMSVVAAFVVCSAAAQLTPQTPIPMDKDVRMGKLDNGMTYYIRHNEKPKGQADFYIHHDVGAIQENDSQQGLAHFLEHMAFNGTKNMPGKMISEYLEKIGVKFGADLNAGTSWDQTVYMVKSVPTTREGIIDTALLILHDWSHFITLAPEEIDAERGVIKEELRTRDGASWRAMQKMLKAIGKGSKYEHRNLIGYLDGLQNFKYQELTDFYQAWYRPDYQAIAVVGDIDVDAVEAKIKSLMSDIPAPAADALQKEVYMVPDNQEPIVSIYTDPEMQGSKVQLFIKRPALPNEYNNRVHSEILNIIQAYIAQMTNARLMEIATKPNAPFLGAGFNTGSLLGIIPTMDQTAATVMTEDGKMAQGFEAVYTELEKIRRHGFTESEYERAQKSLLHSSERAYVTRSDRENGFYIQRCLDNYSKNSAMPDAQTEWQLDSMLLKTLNIEAINKFAQELITPENQVILATGPQKEGVVTPTAEELLAIRDKVMNAEIEGYEDKVVNQPLIPAGTKQKGSPVVKTAHDTQLGTTTWTLKNGIKVTVKPTTYKADEIRMVASSKGGLSVLSDDQYYMGELLTSIMSMSGIGNFSIMELQKQLTGKSAGVVPSVGEYTSSMSGSCSPADLETMFQLLYLNFTSPRFDKDDYETFLKSVRAQLENAKSSPDYIAQEKFIDVVYNHNPRRQMITGQTLDKFSFEQLPAIYAQLFPNANSFAFTFIGNIDLDKLKPFVEKYIGSLPTSKKALTFVDDKVAPVKGIVTEDFRTPMEQPKVGVTYFYSGEVPYTLKNRILMSFLSQALTSRYLISVREEKGGTYGVQVGGSTDYIPRDTYSMVIQFDTNEQMANELCEVIEQELVEMAEKGPDSSDIEKIREFMLKSWKAGLEENSSWLRFILSKNESGLDYLGEYEQLLRSVSASDIQELLQKILADGNRVKIIMRPEAAAVK